MLPNTMDTSTGPSPVFGREIEDQDVATTPVATRPQPQQQQQQQQQHLLPLPTHRHQQQQQPEQQQEAQGQQRPEELQEQQQEQEQEQQHQRQNQQPQRYHPRAHFLPTSPSLKLLPSPAIVANIPETVDESKEEQEPATLAAVTPTATLPTFARAHHLPSIATRPLASRSFTDPSSPSSSALSTPSPTAATMKMATFSLRPRNTSPYSRPHLRTRSSASSMSAPPITRSHSSPSVDTHSSTNGPTSSPAAIKRPASPSPLHYAARRVSPLRRQPADDLAFSFSALDIDQTISENQPLDIITPQAPRIINTNFGSSPAMDVADSHSTPVTPSSPFAFSSQPQQLSTPSFLHRSSSGRRARPSSPLHLLPGSVHSNNRLYNSSSSPALRSPTPPSPASATSLRFAETFPGYGTSASGYNLSGNYASSIHSNASGYSSSLSVNGNGVSSIPSTPTSFRSRSPSISSLETIPDSPDAEREAVRIAEEEKGVREEREREMRERESALGLGMGMGGLSFGAGSGEKEGVQRGRGRFRDGRSGGAGAERKRWSVCGAERRGDLDVIWED